MLSCAGSLVRAALRFAGQPEVAVLDGPFEIVSLTGTLSAAGGSHLHIVLADAAGCTTGGHLLAGSEIFTTAEVVVGVLPGTGFRREHDAATGFPELVVEPRA